MDPKACLARMLSKYNSFEFEAAKWCALDLRRWIAKGGEVPDFTEDERACYDALCEVLGELYPDGK